MLGVIVQNFENLYNAEIRNDKYNCCCDISYTVVPCVKDPTHLNAIACTSECEPYFEIRLEVCFAGGTCSIVEDKTTVIDNILATCITPLLA